MIFAGAGTQAVSGHSCLYAALWGMIFARAEHKLSAGTHVFMRLLQGMIFAGLLNLAWWINMEYFIDLNGIHTAEGLHELLLESLPLPGYYGRNLDALHDALTEISEPTVIRFLNISVPEAGMRRYMSSFRRMCSRFPEENPFVTIAIEEERERA